MSALTYKDLTKRDNIDIFLRRCYQKEQFQIGKNELSPVDTSTGILHIHGNMTYQQYDETNPLTSEQLSNFLMSKTLTDKLFIEMEKHGKIAITEIYKDRHFGGKPSIQHENGKERQERGVINSINLAADKRIPEKSFGQDVLFNGARKNEGMNDHGNEKYRDLDIETIQSDIYGISCKDVSAPSIAGGGIAGLNILVPDYTKAVMRRIDQYFRHDRGFEEGNLILASMVPDIFFRIPDDLVRLVLEGNEIIGGTVDYMYIGPMDVSHKIEDGMMTLNGQFISIDDFIAQRDGLFVRMRKRDLYRKSKDQPALSEITYEKLSKSGHPVYMQNPVNKSPNIRFVVSDSMPEEGELLQI